MKRLLMAAAVTATSLSILPLVANQASAGPKVSHTSAVAGACTVTGGTTVSATGLPTDQEINFLIDDGSGTTGWVLGNTDDGTAIVTLPPASVPTTYKFISRTWGANGSHYTTFAACS